MYCKRFIRACIPALFIMASQVANAASGDGSLVGRLHARDQAAISGAEVTARNPATGFSRTVKAALHDDQALLYPGVQAQFEARATSRA